MSAITGTGLLVRHQLRRDRVLLSAWLLLLTLTVYASAAATPGLYPDPEVRIATAQGWNATPAVVALYGPIMDPASLGELSMTKMTVLYAALVAVMALVVVRRHLRTEEESGRQELVAATAVGRYAPLGGTLVTLVLAAGALGLLCALVNGVAGLPWQGSALFGAAWAGTALVFGAATALACQLSASARTCGLAAGGAIAVAFAIRLAGDVTETWWSWLSPFGWNTRLLAWSTHPRWWVLGLYVALFAALALLASAAASRRDLGSGLVAERPGPARGPRGLGGVFGLAWRTQRAAFGTWLGAVAVLGTLFGAITPNLSGLLSTPAARELIERLGGTGFIEDTMIAAVLGIMAVVISCSAVLVVSHAASHELAGRTEVVLAAPVSRARQFAGVALPALGSVTVLLVVVGVAMGVGYAAAGGAGPADVARLSAAALAHVPATWLVTALVLLLSTVRVGWTWAGWVLVAAFETLGQFGELLQLPDGIRDLSPYAHTPRVPAEAWEAGPLLGLSVATVLVLACASWLHGRRDID